MRIAFLLPRLNVGGGERQLQLLASEIAALGHDVTIIVINAIGAESIELSSNLPDIVSLERKNRLNPLFLFRLIKLIRLIQPHCVYSFLINANVCACLVKPFLGKTKIVMSILDGGVVPTEDGYPFRWRALKLAETLLSHTASLIIANSHRGHRLYAIKGRFPAKKTIVVPNGTDSDWFRPNLEWRQSVRKELGIGRSEILIGLVGRISPVKNQRLFLDAGYQVSRHNPHVRLVCVGSGPKGFEDEIRHHAAELGFAKDVIFTGARTDMERIYPALDVFCLCSNREGLPNVLLEAMACGVPCVSTDVGDTARLLEGVGIVCKPDSTEDLVIALRKMIGRLPKIDHREVRDHILTHYSIESFAQRTLEEINKILSPTAKSSS